MGKDKEEFIASLPEGHNPTNGLIDLSKLMHRIQELVSQYVCVEQDYLLKSVEKAIGETDLLDATDPEQLTTTMVDDAFFILQQSLLRAITTCDVHAVCAVVNNVGGVIITEIKDALVGSLAESKRIYTQW